MKVYVLDMVGYDARGGMATVYATPEGAMAAANVTWEEAATDGEGNRAWDEVVPKGSLCDMWVINEMELHE